jgi:predicted Ser/Thr protein kinase
MIGERLGKWVIFKELGRGGMGRVYLAQEELSGRKAAIKILAAELATDPGFLHRFQREIETLSALQHPNIVRFYESGFENGLFFYAMEYVEGHSLDDVIASQKRLPWRVMLDYGLQICPALKHVHDHGVIHRDLKTANLLVTPDGVVKITDFGIAKVFAAPHLTATHGVVGTAEFLSPEQASGKPVTKRSDLYSLGIVFYNMLTGRLPFEGPSFVELLHKHRYAQFDRPAKIVPELPYEIDEVVCQLLSKDPNDRPADAYVLGKHLDSLRRKLDRKSNRTSVGGGDDHTVTENAPSLSGEPLPGAATLMSRLVRDELDRQNDAGVVGRFLNRPIILATLLILCVGTIAWAFWPLSPEEMYRRGSDLMGSSRLSDKESAWRDYLDPLQRQHPDFAKAEIQKLKQQLDDARSPAMTEAQRFFRRGERLRQEGLEREALALWRNLIIAFEETPEEKDWVRRARESVQDAERDAKAKERRAAVRPILDRAAALRDQDKRADAEKLWAALEELYRNDAGGQEILDEVARARKR